MTGDGFVHSRTPPSTRSTTLDAIQWAPAPTTLDHKASLDVAFRFVAAEELDVAVANVRWHSDRSSHPTLQLNNPALEGHERGCVSRPRRNRHVDDVDLHLLVEHKG